jgi:hypothetical protein
MSAGTSRRLTPTTNPAREEDLSYPGMLRPLEAIRRDRFDDISATILVAETSADGGRTKPNEGPFMTEPKQATEQLALTVWDFLAEYHNDPQSLTDEHKAAIRTEAFQFSRDVKSSDDWRVTYGRRLAASVMVWANNPSEENFRALERTSRAYEELRLR